MKRVVIFLIVILLNGCGVWSSTIRSDVLDYSSAISDTSDQFLLTNILEARDSAPIHFMEMPKITGALQATASLQGSVEMFPHPVNGGMSVINDSLTPNISVESSPTFEVDSVDTKDFAAGVTAAIDPKQIQYWRDRGLDPSLLLDLFLSSLEITARCAEPKEPKIATSLGKAKASKLSNTQAIQYDLELGSYEECIRKAHDHYARWVMIRQCADLGPPDATSQCEESTAKNDSLSYAEETSNCAQTATGKSALAMRKAKDDCLNGGAVIEIRNDPRGAADIIAPCRQKYRDVDCHAITSFEYFLTIANILESHGFSMNFYSERSRLGKAISIKSKNLPLFDPSKYVLEHISDKKGEKGQDLYNVYSVSTDKKLALCLAGRPLTDSGNPDNAQLCSQSESTKEVKSDPSLPHSVEPVLPSAASWNKLPDKCSTYPLDPVPVDDYYCAIYLGYFNYLRELASGNRLAVKAGDTTYTLGIKIRAAVEMLRYLGNLVYFQDNVPRGRYLNNPITQSYDSNCHAGRSEETDPNRCAASDGGYVFALFDKDKMPQDEKAQITVNYRGRDYSIAQYNPGDHTLAALSVLNLSIILNKSPNDIRTTPVIQVVP